MAEWVCFMCVRARLCVCVFVCIRIARLAITKRSEAKSETDTEMDIVLSLSVHIWYTPNGCRYMFQATELCELVAPPFVLHDNSPSNQINKFIDGKL